MTWATRRQLLYVCVVVGFILATGFLLAYPHFHQAPSCFNNVKDGTETGIDCGGFCSRTCAADVDPIAVLWARSFEIVPGRYNAIAYLENKNTNNAISAIHYRFRFSDANNVYLGQREGVTYVPPSGKFAVFEPAIEVGNSVPVYTTFAFIEPPVWTKVSQQKINQMRVSVSSINLRDESTAPRLSATITNNSLFTIPAVNVVAILYNEVGDAVSASQTYIDIFKGNSSQDVNFTWPKPFTEPIVAKELIPMYNVFNVKVE